MDQIIAILQNLEKSTDANTALDWLQQVHVFLTRSVIDYSKFEQLISEAFPSEEDHGLIHFLQSHIADKTFEKSKVEALRILQWLLDSRNYIVRNLIWAQCQRIQKISNLIWENQRESSSTQHEALECIITCLNNFHDQIIISPGDFELATLYGKVLPCSEKSTYTPTVRGKMFQLLGILAVFGVNNFLSKEVKYLQLWNHFIYILKCQVDSVNQHVEGNILQGCIKGLDKFIGAYQDKIPKDDPRLKDLFEKIEQIIDPKCSIENDAQTIKLKRREFQRSALEFVSHHSTFLSSTLFERHEQWFYDLFAWAKSSNADDSKVGMRAMHVFLESVCAYASKIHRVSPSSPQSRLSYSQDTNRNTQVMAFIKFFTETFNTILDKKEATKTEKTVAVKGAGLLATICQDPGVVEQLFSKMIRIIEGVIVELNMPVVDKYSGSHALLPTYLESAGNILLAINRPNNSLANTSFSGLTGSGSRFSHNFQMQLGVVENLSILLITSYPDLSEKYRYFAPMSFLKVIQGLGTESQRKKDCEIFVERVIHEGMTHIIASPTQVEADILVESYNRSNAVNSANAKNSTQSVYNRLGLRTVKFYTSFWIGLVKIKNKSVNFVKVESADDGSEDDDAEAAAAIGDDASDGATLGSVDSERESDSVVVTNLIYNGVIDWILKTMRKLDLSIAFVEDEDNEDGEEENVNMADPVYNTKAAVVKDFQLFVNIVDFLSDFLLKTDAQLFAPWVDVFMEKILNYIKEHPLVSGFYRIIALVFEMMRRLDYFETSSAERDELLTRSRQFLQGLVNKIHEFRDDLLLAVLEVWLSAPNSIILHSCSSLGETLLCVFRTGKNWLPLAQKGIEAIERWFQISEFPEDEMESLFNKLFPVLQSYFAAESLDDEMETSKARSLQDTKVKAKVSSKSRSRRNKAGDQHHLLQAVGSELQETTLRKLQLNILKLFGTYGHLLDVDGFDDSEQIAFSVDGRCLKYVVPFQDIKPDLYIDDFFPRLLKLCNNSTDRQHRSSVCEVFHSFTLYFLGQSANQKSVISNSLDLFRRIFSTVVQLGCDSDIVIRQLFNPLAVQIIHWCTSMNHHFAEFTLNIIVDGLVQSEDPGKRDFSGICLQEYFTWCLKHNNDGQAKQVLKFLISLGQHAAPQYRQGSVLGFNSLYRNFRENSELVNEYTFMLLYSYIICLDLSSDSETDSRTNGGKTSSELVRTTIQSIMHLQRIIVKKRENFNFFLRGRKIPGDFQGGLLSDLAFWLLKKSGESRALVCREHCFRLLSELCPLVKNISGVEGFLEAFNSSQLLDIAERSLNLVTPRDEDNDDMTVILEALEISSDFYAFLKREKYSCVELLLKQSQSKFTYHLETFLKRFKIGLKPKRTEGNSTAGECPEEHSDNIFDFDFNNSDMLMDADASANVGGQPLKLKSKFHAIDRVRVLNIFCNIGALDNAFLLSNIQAQLLVLSAMISVEEAAVNGFSQNCRLIETWLTFWNNLKDMGSLDIADISNTLKEVFKINFKSQGLSLNLVKWVTIVAQKGFLSQIFSVEEIKEWTLEAFKFIDSKLFLESKQKLNLNPNAKRIQKSSNGILEEQLLSNRVQNLIKEVFKLALAFLGPQGGDLVIDKIFDPLLILMPKSSQKTTKGEVYQKYFISSIPYCSQVLDVKRLQQRIGMERIGKLIQKLLVSVKSSKKERQRFGKLIVEKTIQVWDQLSLNCTNDTIATLISGMASLNMNLCRDSLQLANWWSGPDVMTSVNLSLKDKSNFIHFFGLFSLSKKKEIVDTVITTLNDVLYQSLNAVSVDWKTDENFILKIVHTMLKVFEEIPQNYLLLKLLAITLSKIAFLSASDSNSCSTVILKKIEQAVPTVQNYKEQTKMADTIYQCIADEECDDFRQSMVVTKFLLLPLLACVGERAVKEFFKKNINDIAKYAAIKPSSSADWHLKITALNLIEVLCLLKTSTLFFTGPELNSVYLQRLNRTPNPQDSKDCAKDIMKICTSFISPAAAIAESVGLDQSDVRQLVYQSNQAAANVLHAGLRVMGTPLKVVLNIAIKIAPTKTNPERWLNIIDPSVNYQFPILMEAPKQDDLESSPSSISNAEDGATNRDGNIIKAMAATNNRALRKTALATSSLAMDATNYDFTAAVTVENSKFYQRLFGTQKSSGSERSLSRNSTRSQDFGWGHQINQHPCMTPVVETIRNFYKKKDERGNETLMQDLVQALNTLLKNPTLQYHNVRIFLIGAIWNCKSIFKIYALDLKDSILKALLPPQPCFGPELNYMFKDILVMLLEWQEGLENDRLLSSEQVRHLLEFILPNVWHERRDVLAQHLEILEAVVKTWKPVAETEAENIIPFDKVAELMAQSESKIGMEVCKHILLGGLLPCPLSDESCTSGFDVKRLFHTVSKNFASTSKLTYGLGGKVIGLLFRQLEINGCQTDLTNAAKYVEKVLDKERNKPQQLLTILNNIQTFYGPFIIPYKTRVFELLRTESMRSDVLQLVPGILKFQIEKCGSNSDSCKKLMLEFYSDLDGRGVFRNPCKNELEAQSAVKLLTEFIDNNFNDEHRFIAMIEWMEVEAEKSMDIQLKLAYASAVSKLYYTFGGRREKSVLSTKAHKLFIRLQNDTDEKMKIIVADFWERNLKSWKDSPSLILELVEILGDEKNAISISIDLIMKRCGLSPDYEKSIFVKDLGDCVFQKYDLDTSWRMRHSTFQPLYAESLSSSQNFSQFPRSLQAAVMSQRQTSGGGSIGMNVLRATLKNLQFSATAPGQSQSSVMNDSNDPMDVDFGGSFNSDRFYSSFNYHGSDEGENEDGSSGRTGGNKNDNSGSQNILDRLRKRFYERPPTLQLSSNFFARRALEKREAQVEREVEAIRSKRSGIKLIRSYRIGELPDVMMKNSDFLATILAMTKSDEQIGRNFLVHLFTGILTEVNQRDPPKAKKFASNSIRTFENVLRKYGSSISPEFGATILEITIVNGKYIKIQPDLISNAGRHFGVQQLAILKLEGVLEEQFRMPCSSDSKSKNRAGNECDNEGRELEPKSKKARFDTSNESDCSIVLLRIAQLYKDLEDFEAVRSVFLMAGERTSNEDLSNLYRKGCEALKYESEGMFEEAFELYEQLCNNEHEIDSVDDYFGEERHQLWNASAFQCLEQLSKWDEVYERAEEYVKHSGADYSTIFNDDVYTGLILPHQLTSAIQILIRDQESSNENQDLSEGGDEGSVGLKDQIRDYIELLKTAGSLWEGLIEEYIDLSVLSIHYDNDIGHTSSWLDKNLSTSLAKFYNFFKISKLERKIQLRTLQRTSILQDYVNWQKVSRHLTGAATSGGVLHNLEKDTLEIISKWKHCGKSKTSSLFNADIVVAEKNYLLVKMGCYLEEKLEDFESIFDEMKIANYQQHLWLADLSIRNQNHTLAWKTFRKTKNVSDGLEEKLMVDFKILLSEYLTAFTEQDERWDTHWVTCWKSLRKLERDEDLRSSFWEVKANLLSSLFTKLSLGPLDGDSKIRKQLGIPQSANLVQHIATLAIGLGENVLENGDVETSGCKIHMRLYYLLKEIKRKCERGLSAEDISQLHLYMLTSLLRAMQNGETESLRLFPTSFAILDKYPELLPTFEKMIVGIPSWMFLPWLDQIVVNYKNTALLKPVLDSIIELLVADYPHAFQLQYTDLLLARRKLPDVYALYSEALTAVTVPYRLIKEYLPNLQNPTISNLLLSLSRLKNKLMDIKGKSHLYGDLHQNYINSFLPKVNAQIKRLEEANSNCDSSNSEEDQEASSVSASRGLVKSVVQCIWKLGADCAGKESLASETIRLDRFSPWLAKFRSSQFHDYLEVPGLYSQFHAPNTNFHPKIVSFYPTVLQIHSLTKPIRVTLLCNNGKEIRFLVKKGDDLRQDKRIQQCFRVANEIFKGDPRCRERRLQITTYNVVPITNDFGLIEWIDKTVSLKRLILNSRKLEDIYHTQREQYCKWIGSSRSNPYRPYHTNAQLCGRADAEKKFNACVNRMPSGLMREHILEGCNSLEDYFTLREKMIRSYATMCLVHWMLGIGDRHLENSLISTETGEFIGIDFGRSFGIAIFKQDIPELIPFRLTPQIQNFLEPYGTNGLFKETMLCAKRAMKKSSELLIAVADVFIKEPLTDWLKNRERPRPVVPKDGPEPDPELEEDVPDRMEIEREDIPLNNDNLDRIKILTSKLMGKNPISIIGQDVQKLKDQLRPIYINILKDGRGTSAIQHKLTDEEYVDILISLATDANILARLYEGWSSWL